MREDPLSMRTSAQGRLQLAALGLVGMPAVPKKVLAAPATAAVAKTYTLPAPTLNVNKALKARRSTWKDTLPSRLSPNDVQQQEILNCYFAATFAALANTSGGKALIGKIIQEKRGKIITTCHDYAFDGTRGAAKKIESDRYFEVKFQRSKTIVVSDVLYMDDSDRNWNPRYMTSPNDVLWPCIAEVAYASFRGSYEKIDATNNLSINDFITDLIGPRFTLLHIKSGQRYWSGKSGKLTPTHVRAACKNAGTTPVVGASKTNAASVTGWHGYAVLGLSGSRARLYDPLTAKETTLDLKSLWKDFEALFVLKV